VRIVANMPAKAPAPIRQTALYELEESSNGNCYKNYDKSIMQKPHATFLPPHLCQIGIRQTHQTRERKDPQTVSPITSKQSSKTLRSPHILERLQHSKSARCTGLKKLIKTYTVTAEMTGGSLVEECNLVDQPAP
jgi:hypothetical protein